MAGDPELWTDAFLGGMRAHGDPTADPVVAEVFAQGALGDVNRLLTGMVRNDQPPPAELPPVVREYFATSAAGVELDPEIIRRGEQVFLKHGNLVLVILLCASLPECYVLARGVRVLYLTKDLGEHTFRRLLETCQMVLAVMSPGGLSPSGGGVRAAQKVRLMHAAIRHLVLSPAPEPGSNGHPTSLAEALQQTTWDLEGRGLPVNQEDMAYTLLTFGYVIPRGLEALGVELLPEEREAFFLCWNHVGRLMGIREDLLAPNYQQGAWLFERIKALEGAPSVEGQYLMGKLMLCVREALPHFADDLPPLLITELLDRQTLDFLGVRPRGLLGGLAARAVLEAVRVAAGLKRDVGRDSLVGRQLWQWVSGRTLKHLCNLGQPPGWNRRVFEIPEQLASAWELNS